MCISLSEKKSLLILSSGKWGDVWNGDRMRAVGDTARDDGTRVYRK
jgi:hypothetical protein